MERLDQSLPIFEVMERLQQALTASDTLVLQAAPGAGKTTVVPLILLQASWLLPEQKMLVVEPRRLAAKSAAERMASALGEQVGETVGYRVRQDRKVSAQTRIEVITYGMLLHDLQESMDLPNVAAVLLDEFHERPLDADLALAQLLYMRPVLRGSATPLKLLLMSATLDAVQLVNFLQAHDTQVQSIESPGRQYPVNIVYSAAVRRDAPLTPRVISILRNAMQQHAGNILIFLPGRKEIAQVEAALRTCIADSASGETNWFGLLVVSLHGDLSLDAQRQAILPAVSGQRKIVLATALAESSVTVAGVHIVIDSGLARIQRFDANTGIARLETTWVSAASSAQRAGRAGRIGPGVCYRLWSETQQTQLPAHLPSEIQRSDLSPLVLSLAHWGIHDLDELSWLDKPSISSLSAAATLLEQLGLFSGGRLSALGQALAPLQLPPRLSLLLGLGKAFDLTEWAAVLVVLLEENRLRLSASDLMPAVEDLLQSRSSVLPKHLLGSLKHRFKQWQKRSQHLSMPETLTQTFSSDALTSKTFKGWAKIDAVVFLLAHAYPDRIARLRSGATHDYLLSSGRGARLFESDELVGEPWLLAMDLSGHSGRSDDVIRLSMALPEFLLPYMTAMIKQKQRCEWHTKHDRLIATELQSLGAIILSEHRQDDVPEDIHREAIRKHLTTTRLTALTIDESVSQWLARVSMARAWLTAQAKSRAGVEALPDSLPNSLSDSLPDLSIDGLLASLDDWFFSFVQVKRLRKGADLKRINMLELLRSQLDWAQTSWLDDYFPERFRTPAGQVVDIDYHSAQPTIAAKLQAFFGCSSHPNLAHGNLPLTVALLSPARRPIQITQDLPGFWHNSYDEVKKEMKGRYPKHPWPDDPAHTKATLRVKPKQTKPKK